MTADLPRELDVLPPALRALLQAELAAGNTIDSIDHAHPAPPIGLCVRLAQTLRTPPPDAATGIGYRRRNSSLWSGEFASADGRFFVLEPPLPPPPEPDMDAIRAAVNAPRPRVVPALGPDHAWVLKVDHRGESVSYCEAERSTTAICSFGRPTTVYARTLDPWFYPAERRSQPLTAEERTQVLARIAEGLARDHGAGKVVVEDTA